MKKKYLLYLTLFTIIAFVILNITSAGDKHIIVVEENEVLIQENGQLKTENGNLKNENNRLTNENKSLNEQMSKLNSEKETIKPVKNIEKIVQNKIEEEYGWATPDYVYDILSDKLKRKPMPEEYKMSLLEVLGNKSLFYASSVDPQSPGKAITKKDIESLVNLKFK